MKLQLLLKKQTWYFCLDFLLTKTYQVEMVVSHQKSLYILIVM